MERAPQHRPWWPDALNPLAAVRRRFTRWWQARLPLADTTVLTQRNVYILPTGAGWMLALTLLVLLVASINFQLNLGYLLTFLLAGSAVVGMHICHATLRGLTLHLKPTEPHFLGHSATLEVQLSSERRTPRHSIALAVHGSGHWAWTDVPAQGTANVQVAFAAPHRGLQQAFLGGNLIGAADSAGGDRQLPGQFPNRRQLRAFGQFAATDGIAQSPRQRQIFRPLTFGQLWQPYCIHDKSLLVIRSAALYPYNVRFRILYQHKWRAPCR